MSSPHRKQLLVDHNIQYGIVLRFLLYAILSFLFVTLPISFFRMWDDPSQLWVSHVAGVWVDYSPVLICIAAFVPFAIFDLLKFSNRFVGPIFRLRQEFKRLRNGEQVETINFRDNDFWLDLSDNFNELSGQIRELKAENQKLASKLAEK